MGFTELTSLDAEVTVALGKVNKETGKPYPKQAEGFYLGKRTVENKKGDSNLHFLQTAKGNLGVWGTSDLDRKLSQVIPGTMVRITSTGTKETPRGDMYTYKVEVDRDNTIDIGFDTSNSDEEYVSNTEDYSTTGADEDSSQAAGLAALERKARVDALLAKTSRKN